MKKILYFWDLSHQKLVQCILNMLTDEKDEVRTEKIKYALNYIVGEMEKMIALLCIFSLFSMVKVFLISFFSLVLLRIFMGGTHRNTMLTCFLQALLTFTIICGFGKMTDIYPYRYVIYVFVTILIWISTPVESEKRIRYSKHQAMVFKAKALTVLLLLSILCDWLDVGIRNYVLWAIGFQGMEIVGIILWKGRQSVLCVKN